MKATVTQQHRDYKTRRSIAYVSIKDETFLENFGNRAARPHKVWQPAVEAALREAGIEFERLSWSQKAGCRCGCSPGFYIKGRDHLTVWLDVEGSPKTTDPELSARRTGQLLSDPTIVGALKAT